MSGTGYPRQGTVPSTVTTMNWTTKYHTRLEFMAYFLDEQEYIDAMFIQIIMENFGVWLTTDQLYKEW